MTTAPMISNRRNYKLAHHQHFAEIDRPSGCLGIPHASKNAQGVKRRKVKGRITARYYSGKQYQPNNNAPGRPILRQLQTQRCPGDLIEQGQQEPDQRHG